MTRASDSYAVLGNPVSHSLSPRIHHRFAEQTGERISYRAIELDREGFDTQLQALKETGLRGANVTVPFKQQAWEICDRLSERARQAAAVNTLSFDEAGSVAGDNTDGLGLVRDLSANLGLSLAQQNILILGAGGAVRGVLGPLLELAPRRITIANRNLDRARQLTEDFNTGDTLGYSAYADLGSENFDLIINATAAGLSNEVPPIPESLLEADCVCYDMIYNIEEATSFLDWASKRGVTRTYDGLGMLVEQAAESFYIWRGVRPDTGEVIQSLRQA